MGRERTMAEMRVTAPPWRDGDGREAVPRMAWDWDQEGGWIQVGRVDRAGFIDPGGWLVQGGPSIGWLGRAGVGLPITRGSSRLLIYMLYICVRIW